MIERRFWHPSVTSQFTICPIPFHMDTYRGCVYNCSYCFARDFTTFSRRNSEHKDFTYLVGNRPDLFANWVKKTLAKDYDLTKAHEVAFKERIPLKIGATADPFPFIEERERVTYEILKILQECDYPVEIQTKNPEVLLSYAQDFIGANWTIAVTLISTDEAFLKVCEPNAPVPNARLRAIKRLVDLGFKVMVKVQPAVYPKIIEDLPTLVKEIAQSGAWAFNIEGLKVRVSMPVEEQLIMQRIGDYLNYDIRSFYRNEKNKPGSDFELSLERKEEFIFLADCLAKEYNLKFFNADNHIVNVGSGCECCGTEVLRDYKTLSCNKRSKLFGATNGSDKLAQCFVNFTRSSKYNNQSIEEVCDK